MCDVDVRRRIRIGWAARGRGGCAERRVSGWGVCDPGPGAGFRARVARAVVSARVRANKDVLDNGVGRGGRVGDARSGRAGDVEWEEESRRSVWEDDEGERRVVGECEWEERGLFILGWVGGGRGVGVDSLIGLWDIHGQRVDDRRRFSVFCPRCPLYHACFVLCFVVREDLLPNCT